MRDSGCSRKSLARRRTAFLETPLVFCLALSGFGLSRLGRLYIGRSAYLPRIGLIGFTLLPGLSRLPGTRLRRSSALAWRCRTQFYRLIASCRLQRGCLRLRSGFLLALICGFFINLQ